MVNTRILGAAAVALALTVPVTGTPQSVGIDGGATRIGITGFVPVICRASVSATSVSTAPGTVSLGELREFCNSPRGYRVHADYSPSLAQAKLFVDGVPVPLHRDGTSVVSRSNRAAIDARSLSLQLPSKVDGGGSISFRIEPL